MAVRGLGRPGRAFARRRHCAPFFCKNRTSAPNRDRRFGHVPDRHGCFRHVPSQRRAGRCETCTRSGARPRPTRRGAVANPLEGLERHLLAHIPKNRREPSARGRCRSCFLRSARGLPRRHRPCVSLWSLLDAKRRPALASVKATITFGPVGDLRLMMEDKQQNYNHWNWHP